MNGPKRYTVEELELIYKEWRGDYSAIGLVPEFIEHLSSLQEQPGKTEAERRKALSNELKNLGYSAMADLLKLDEPEQPVEYFSHETHPTGTPKIEPLTPEDFLNLDYFGKVKFFALTEQGVEKLVALVNQLALKKE